MTWSRRQFVRAGLVGPMAGTLWPRPAVGRQAPPSASGVESRYADNIYTRLLGVRPHLPAHEHISRLGGGRMAPEVVRAIAEANNFFVDMRELNRAAGERIASLIGAEAATVTAGGFSGLLLGAAACLTGTDEARISALPYVTWPRRECLIQTPHRFSYDRAFSLAGMTIVEAETREAFRAALTDRTAMIAVLAAMTDRGQWFPPVPVSRAPVRDPAMMTTEELIGAGKAAGVPVLVDTASDIPPKANLSRYFEMGADLVVLSGGKGLGGPQSTGILAGRRDLVEAAVLNASPNDHIGRGMKVGKEEIVGLVVALERYLAIDEEALKAEWKRKAEYIAGVLRDVPGLTAEAELNTGGYVDVALSWDRSTIPLEHAEVRDRLMAGTPPLTYDGTTVRTRNLADGEEVLVARRLREFFTAASRYAGRPR